MMSSFQSILENVDKYIQSLEWKTDKGVALHGVLHRKDNRIYLNVNPKELKEAVEFDYLYHEDDLGVKRVLYPYDFQGSKTIPHKSLSSSWPIEVALLIDEQNTPEITSNNEARYTYDSFLWHKVPESEVEKDEFDRLMLRLSMLETSIGKVTVAISRTENYSISPSRYEKRMDKIVFAIQFDSSPTNKEILMWHIRFSQFLTIINRERVVLRAIHHGLDNILVPSLVEDYKAASYAFRKPVGLTEYVELVENTLPVFVDKYSDVAGLFEDLVQYYHDYPVNPPDNIQLLRLFSGLEQCVNHFASQIPKPKKSILSAEEKFRDQDFNNLLLSANADGSISTDLKKYLKNKSKKYYVTPEKPSSAKNRIVAFADFIVNDIGVFSHLTSLENAGIVWNMRSTVAHGFYDGDIKDRFYQRRDDFGQDIEQCVRIYVLHALGVNKELIVRHKEPLKAREFNRL